MENHEPPHKKPLVMIVEDNLDLRRCVSKCFQIAGCIVNDFENGMEAHRILSKNSGEKRTNQYDLILSDIDMPEMDGLSLAKEAAILASETPFILMTGRPRDSYPENVLEVIEKPFEYTLCERLIENYIHNGCSKYR